MNKLFISALSLGFVLSFSTYSLACGGGGSMGQQSHSMGQSQGMGCGDMGAQNSQRAMQGDACMSNNAGADAQKATQGDSCAMDNTSAHNDHSAHSTDPSKLIEAKCGLCHSPSVVFFSKKADWANTVYRMEKHREMRRFQLLTSDEKNSIINYLNTYMSPGKEVKNHQTRNWVN